jgi:hypothetical protein
MRKDRRLLGFILLMFLSLSCYSAHAAGTGSIPVGTTLPGFKLEGPSAKADQEYLGLKGGDPFTLSQVSGKLVIIDFISVL